MRMDPCSSVVELDRSGSGITGRAKAGSHTPAENVPHSLPGAAKIPLDQPVN